MSMFRVLVAAAAVNFVALVALPAMAQGLMPRTPTAVFEAARTFGEIEFTDPDSEGRPVLLGDIDGIYYSMVVFGCDAFDGCESVQFYASFISDDNATLEFANDWNLDKRWVTAFLDTDGDMVITMTANIRYGVTRENFLDTFDVWRSLMLDFNDRIYANDVALPRK